jgi:CDP-diacylglycerol--glycerol-3-phosphate 3-phosphatidyltransferase
MDNKQKGTIASHHGWELPTKDTLLTYASGLTLVRTILAVVFAILAAMQGSQWLLLAALLCYWIGDILDGIIARFLNQEMRSGAVFDIMADRLCVSLIYLTYGWMHPDMLWPIGLYLFEFMFIDGFLSLSFLYWPLLSPNYFFLVDRRIFNLNWSPLGKAANSSFFLLASVFIGNPIISGMIAIVVIAVKLYSLNRLYTIGIPTSALASRGK